MAKGDRRERIIHHLRKINGSIVQCGASQERPCLKVLFSSQFPSLGEISFVGPFEMSQLFPFIVPIICPAGEESRHKQNVIAAAATIGSRLVE